MSENVKVDDNNYKWKPENTLSKVDEKTVRYSNGFLKAKLEHWFPSIPIQWESLINNLELDFDFISITPEILPGFFNIEEVAISGVLELENDFLALELPAELKNRIRKIIGISKQAENSIAFEDYLCRRLLNSLELSWSGPELTPKFYYSKIFDNNNLTSLTKDFNFISKVKVNFNLNSKSQEFNIYFGTTITDILHNLWLKQLRSRTSQNLRSGDIGVEIGSVFIDSSDVGNSLKSGALHKIEKRSLDEVFLLYERRPWLPAKLYDFNGKFAVKIRAGSSSLENSKKNLIRLSFEIANVTLDSMEVLELNQRGAFLETEQAFGALVTIRVNGEVLGKGEILMVNGSLAVKVV